MFHRSVTITLNCLSMLWLYSAVPSAAAGPPNVLMIAIDDLNDWVGCLQGHPLSHTPHLDGLAKSGTLFLNAHCQAPLCNPSRTSLMTGLRPATTGVYGLAPWFRSLPEWQSRVTLPQYFQSQGYRTLTTGKVYHGGAGGPRQRLHEFDVWGPGGGVGAKPSQKLIPPTPMGNHPLMDWGTFPHEEGDKTDTQMTTWAIDQLARLTGPQSEQRPFFMAVGYSLPHVPLYVTPKYYDRFPDSDALLPPLKTGDRRDTPRFSWYLHWKLPEPRWSWVTRHEQGRNLCRSYLASVSFVDAQVGRLIQAVETSNLKEQTVIVLWSDHGYHLGEKAITGKNTLWERSTRVPLIFSGPGVTPGGVCQQPAELLDIYPTLAELCGFKASDDLEGLSLVPQLKDAATVRERPALTTHNPGNHAVRSTRYRYIHYADGSEELYDLQADPNEWTNLVTDEQYGEILVAHRRWLPTQEAPHAAGSLHRVLTYDAATDTAHWEGEAIGRSSPIPESVPQ